MTKLQVYSLFTGVGGFDLGLERAGMEIVGQAESDQFAASVLRRHWPNVELMSDVRDVTTVNADMIVGGFPCQGYPAALDGWRVRKLTPLECERLQGFPDNWTAIGVNEKGREVKVSDTQRIKQMGNAVTVNVIEWIGGRIVLTDND